MVKTFLSALSVGGFIFFSAHVVAQDSEQPYTSLLKKAGTSWGVANYTEEELNQPGMLCIRFNNYWCIKSPKGKPRYWNGQIDQDDRGHAKFSHPKFAARAFVKLMRTYYVGYGLKSASQIMNRYAPPTDTIGSVAGGAPNPTQEYATQIAKLLGKTADDDLELFNSDNSVNRDNMVAMLQALAKWEITAKHLITKELALDGIALSGL